MNYTKIIIIATIIIFIILGFVVAITYNKITEEESIQESSQPVEEVQEQDVHIVSPIPEDTTQQYQEQPSSTYTAYVPTVAEDDRVTEDVIPATDKKYIELKQSIEDGLKRFNVPTGYKYYIGAPDGEYYYICLLDSNATFALNKETKEMSIPQGDWTFYFYKDIPLTYSQREFINGNLRLYPLEGLIEITDITDTTFTYHELGKSEMHTLEIYNY